MQVPGWPDYGMPSRCPGDDGKRKQLSGPDHRRLCFVARYGAPGRTPWGECGEVKNVRGVTRAKARNQIMSATIK